MEKDKNLGLILAAAGFVVLVVMLTADLTGLGTYQGWGPHQIIGTVAGALLLVVGVVVWLRRR